LALLACIIIVTSCSSPVTLTGWKDPKATIKVSKIVVLAMFKKLEYQKPFENAAVDYFNSKGIKAIPSLKLLAPNRMYEQAELVRILDSIGADGVLVFNYTGLDKTENYVPETTTIHPQYYNNFYGYYSYGYNMYSAPGYNEVTTGGYWTETNIINLTSNLYNTTDKSLVWTGKISVTDPEYVDLTSTKITKYIYSEWEKEGLVPVKK
jgi:hypothetical protein